MTWSRLDVVAIVFATILSLGCLVRGAVDDAVLALMVLSLLPLVFLSMYPAHSVERTLAILGIIIFSSVLCVLCLQQFLQGSDVWDKTQQITQWQTRPVFLEDKAAWFKGIGRLLLIVIAFTIALLIGTSESSSRYFLQTLLVTGTGCVAMTFLLTTADGATSGPRAVFSHGFVNANNAATYFGIMLLLTFTQAARLFRKPIGSLHKILTDFVDKPKLLSIMKGFVILFALLFTLSGLLMTESRGGIFLSLLCSIFLIGTVVYKSNMSYRHQQWIFAIYILLLLGIFFYIFSNFVEEFVAKLLRDGLDNHIRSEIFSAVIPMIRDHPWLGVGLGGFPSVFQQYRPTTIYPEGMIDKAHNTYLEFAAEMGLPLFLVCIVGFLCVAYLLCRGVLQRQERYLIPLFGISVLLLAGLHSLVDFPLQIPAIGALFVAILTVCSSQADPRFSELTQISGNAPIKRIRVRKRMKPVVNLKK